MKYSIRKAIPNFRERCKHFISESALANFFSKIILINLLSIIRINPAVLSSHLPQTQKSHPPFLAGGIFNQI